MKMVKIVHLLSLFLLLCSGAEAKKPVKFSALQDSAGNGITLSVLVDAESLKNVSRNILMAESWLRNHVLSFYPEINVGIILVGKGVMCSKDKEHMMVYVLPAIKNIQHSLSKWGLEKDIKVSASFSTECLDSMLRSYRDDVAEAYIKPLLAALQETNSPYVVEPPPYLEAWSDEVKSLLKYHSKSIENLGVHHPIAMNVMSSQWKEEASIDAMSPSPAASSAYVTSPPFPAKIALAPSPLDNPPPENVHSPVAKPPASPFSSQMPPANHQANPPFGPHLPPCEPSHRGGSGSVGSATNEAVWCVAKASVPFETLQKSLDFACGEGGVDCGPIGPGGSCYFPDNIVAHASYAFNSYWQRHKRNGGTCGFGGTAMLISSNPSYGHCTYILT